MRAVRVLVAAVLLPIPATAGEETDDWKMIGGALALVQRIVSLAAHSPDPEAVRKGVDTMLSGQDPQANRLAAGLLDEMLLDVPSEHRGTFVSIARDLLVVARREQAKAAAAPASASPEAALQARKELHAMGLRYWDEQQFLDAARRGDRIAVELFLAARGLETRNPLPAR